jgi:hypothetical protein
MAALLSAAVGDAMGVTAEIGQHLFGAAERWLGVDHPVEVPQFAEMAVEGVRLGKAGEIVEEPQLGGVEGIIQLAQEQLAESCFARRRRRSPPSRSASHGARANPWHFGQWRLPQEL